MQEGRGRKFLESRYTLRELQGAIGYDCRRLHDGRLAEFRHTFIHRRIRRDFFDRQDAITVINASLMAISSLGSHYRIDITEAADMANASRSSLVKSAFPYMDFKEPEPVKSDKIDVEAIMKELREINARNKKKAESGGGDEDGPVGHEVVK